MKKYQSGWGQAPTRRRECRCRARGVWHRVIARWIICKERGNLESSLNCKETSLWFEAHCNMVYAGAADEEDWLPQLQLRHGQQQNSHFHPNISLNFPQVLLISHCFHCELIWFSFSATSCSIHKNSWLWMSKFNTDFHCGFMPGFLQEKMETGK